MEIGVLDCHAIDLFDMGPDFDRDFIPFTAIVESSLSKVSSTVDALHKRLGNYG